MKLDARYFFKKIQKVIIFERVCVCGFQMMQSPQSKDGSCRWCPCDPETKKIQQGKCFQNPQCNTSGDLHTTRCVAYSVLLLL